MSRGGRVELRARSVTLWARGKPAALLIALEWAAELLKSSEIVQPPRRTVGSADQRRQQDWNAHEKVRRDQRCVRVLLVALPSLTICTGSANTVAYLE